MSLDGFSRRDLRQSMSSGLCGGVPRQQSPFLQKHRNSILERCHKVIRRGLMRPCGIGCLRVLAETKHLPSDPPSAAVPGFTIFRRPVRPCQRRTRSCQLWGSVWDPFEVADTDPCCSRLTWTPDTTNTCSSRAAVRVRSLVVNPSREWC